MPTRSDEPTRTRPQVVVSATSSLSTSPAASPELEPAEAHELTQESFVAIMSSHQRGGRWEPADEIQVRAIAGEVVLDFTQAELPPSGVIEIDARAICGEIKIIVPADADIQVDGKPILGSIEHEAADAGALESVRGSASAEGDADLPAPPEPPYFHIYARAILGAIKVVTGR